MLWYYFERPAGRAPPAATALAVYHVSSTGNDTNDGRSPTTAWQTVARANAGTYNAGDQLLFQGGQTFSGALAFDASKLLGTAAQPVTIGSYGTGRATISSGSAAGFTALDVAGFQLRDLVFIGNGTSDVNGVLIHNSQSGNGKLQYIRVLNVEILGYGQNGLALMGGTGGGNAGFNDVILDMVEVHDCTNINLVGATAGIAVFGRYGYNAAPTLPTHTNVEVIRSQAYDNPGRAGADNWTGSGIFMAQTQVGAIRLSVAYNNGENSNSGGNAVGIWAADADQITIEFCESYLNKTGASNDGCGFDFDGGTTNSIVQYCYSHDNDGPGYMLFDYDDPEFMVNWDNNTVRYNISQNDSKKTPATYGCIFVASHGNPMTNLKIYNNVVYTNISTGKALSLGVGSASNGRVANNIFYSATGAYLVDTGASNPSGFQFRGNDYYAASTFRIRWANTTYSTLTAWRSGSAQEIQAGVDVGTDANPLLVAPGTGGTIDGYNPASLTAYQTQPASPMRDAGLDLLTLFSINPGDQDFYGNAIPVTSFDIGAFDGVALQFWAGSLRLAQAPTDGGTFSTTAITQATAAGLGIAGIRHNALMASPPTAGPWSWSAYSTQWAAMQSAGLRLYLTLFDGAPGGSTYPGKGDSAAAATERSRWAAQALNVAQHLEATYPGLLAAIEIWNEPDGSWPIPAADYVLLAAAVKATIRSDASLNQIPIVGPAGVLMGTYFDALISNGLADEVDWISIHVYSNPHLFEGRFIATRDKLALVGAQDYPIVVSEWGAEGNAGTPWEVGSGLAMLRAQGAKAASYFPLQDYPTFSTQGLITSAGAAKIQGNSWKTWHANIGEGATYVGQNTSLPFTIEAHQFSVGGLTRWVVWASSGTPSISVAGTYTAQDVDGTSITAGATQVLGASPIYLFGNVTITLTPGQDVLLAGNVAQFSDIQGQDGWSYHSRYTATGLYNSPTTPHYDSVDGRWELAGKGSWNIDTGNMHPALDGSSHVQAVRRWTVPTGITRVKVTGTWTRSSSAGDGSDVALWHGSTARFRRGALREGAGGAQESPVAINQVFNVVVNDVLEFRVGAGPAADLNSDNTSLNILIYQTADAVTGVDDDLVLDAAPQLPTSTTSTQTVSPGVTSATINGFAANTKIIFDPGTYTNLSIVPKNGQWFQGRDGSAATILTSTLSSTRAFSGSAQNVFIQGLTIRDYNPGSLARSFTPIGGGSSEAQKAAIEYTGTANEALPGTAISWTTYQCRLTSNYGRGVNVTNGDWVSQTEISDNAGNGGGGRGFDIKFTDCDIFNNNRWDMSKTNDGAGVKFGGGATPGDILIPPCRDIIFRRCKIHDNNGHAIWTDWDVFDVEIDHCSIYANAWGAISAEACATYWIHHCQIGDNLRVAPSAWNGSAELNWQSCKKSIVEDNLFACYNNASSDFAYMSQHHRMDSTFQGGVYIGHFTCVENTFRRNVILQRSGALARARDDFTAGGLCTQNNQACTGVACSQNCGTAETGCELLFEGGVPAGGLGGNVHCFVPASTAAHFNVAQDNTWRSAGTPPAFPGGAWGSETGRTTGGSPDSFLPTWSVIPTWTTPPGKI